MSAPGFSHAQLFDRLPDGAAGAIADLVERFTPAIYRLAQGMLDNAADVERVLHEVCLWALRDAVTLRGDAELRRWLYRATVITLEARRGSGSEETAAIEKYLPKYGRDGHRKGDRTSPVADWSSVPDEELLSAGGRAAIRRALHRLPHDDRIVFLLRDVEALSSAEVGYIIDMPVASIDMRLHRARMALREQLTEVYGPRPHAYR